MTNIVKMWWRRSNTQQIVGKVDAKEYTTWDRKTESKKIEKKNKQTNKWNKMSNTSKNGIEKMLVKSAKFNVSMKYLWIYV